MAEIDKRIEYVPVEQLRFDPLNPRLPTTVDGGDREAVIAWMLRDTTLVELMGSIGEEGYFPGEPMLVAPSSGGKTWDVVEGNRRLAAVLLLHDPSLATVRKKGVSETAAEASAPPPDPIPVIKYESRDEILNYLGYRHITGIKRWSTLSKARYLKELRQQFLNLPEKKQFRTLAKRIGSRSDYVGRLLAGLAIYEQIEEEGFYGIRGLDEETIEFSVITTALNYSKIATFLGLKSGRDPELTGLVEGHLHELVEWMFKEYGEGQTRIGESRNLSKLARVVDNEAALKAFRGGRPLEDAYNLTGAPSEVFQSHIEKALSSLMAARDQLHLIEPSGSDADRLKEVARLAWRMKDAVEGALFDGDLGA